MAAEVRHIIFRPVEVALAIREFRRCMRRALPGGLLCDVQIEEMTDCRVRAIVELNPAAGGGPHRVEVSQDDLLEAIILFCIEREIPLPASAKKMLRKNGDCLALVIALEPPPAPCHESFPIPSSRDGLTEAPAIPAPRHARRNGAVRGAGSSAALGPLARSALPV